MRLDVGNQKVTLLRNILLELTTKKYTIVHDDKFILEINNKFEELYYLTNDNEGFRHFYPDIFSTLINMKNRDIHIKKVRAATLTFCFSGSSLLSNSVESINSCILSCLNCYCNNI